MEWDAIQPGKMQGVYAFFVRGTEQCLYVGESSNLRSRINGHYNNSKSSDLRGLVGRDDNPPVTQDELRHVTEVRILQMPGSDASNRRTVERNVIEQSEPLYPK